MRVGKDGKLKLSKDERQVGNFIVKNEKEHFKISDINSLMTHRVSKALPLGRFLEEAWKRKENTFLEHYSALVWNFSNTVADEQFFLDISKSCNDCIMRHHELYNIDVDIDAAKDKEILEEERDVHEEIEMLKEEGANEASEK